MGFTRRSATALVFTALVFTALSGGCATQRHRPGPEALSWDDCEPPLAHTASTSPEAGGAGEIGEGMDEPGLRVAIFSIGQADSMLLLAGKDGGPQMSMLVDLGEPVQAAGAAFDEANYEVVAAKLAQLLPLDKKLDYFVLSHFHADHAGRGSKTNPTGIFGLIEKSGFKIGTFIHPGSEQDAHFGDAARAIYHETISHLAKWTESGQVTQARAATPGEVIKLGSGVNVTMTTAGGKVSSDDTGTLDAIVAKHGDIYGSIGPPSENDLSVSMMIRYGQFEMFTGGDLTGASDDEIGQAMDYTPRSFGADSGQVYSNVEKRLVELWRKTSAETDVEIYRANHHGSQHSSTAMLLDALDPEFVIYSAGGMYGHPSHEVADRCSKTARQFVTTRLDDSAWELSAFRKLRGKVVQRDITIRVGKKGLWYSLNRELHKAFNDQQERSGKDEGEEDRHWASP